MSTPRYALRVGRLPEVFEVLAADPEGVPIDRLADRVGVPVEELREDLLAFFTADLVDADPLLGLWRPPVLEFLGPDGGDDIDPRVAERVRIIDDQPAGELGVEHVDAAELALIHTAAAALHEMAPDPDLGAAIEALTETLLGRPASQPDVQPWHRALGPLQTAQQRRHATRIVYSRAWDPGITPRVIHPYRLVQTRRGWEVDAGPPDGTGRLRTFLLSNIREVEVLEETFDLPDGLPAMLDAQRATTTVRLCLPHDARWAADMYAEQVRVVAADEESVSLDVDLLPPLERRVGMLLLAAGPEGFVVDPPELEVAGVELAEELLVHHSVRR